MTSSAMPYIRDISKLKVEPALFTFPGDELFDTAAYNAAMVNTYLRKVPLAGVLMERFDISFEAEDRERIKRLMVSMGWLDHLLDEAPDRDAALVVYRDLMQSLNSANQLATIPGWVRPELRDVMILLRNATRPLPAEYARVTVDKALRIGVISIEKSASTNVKNYAASLAEEGALSSDLAIECLGANARKSQGYSKLHEWNRQAMAAATLLDAALDIKQDYAESLTKVRPTAWHRIYLFCQAFAYIPTVVRGLGLRGIKTVTKIGVN